VAADPCATHQCVSDGRVCTYSATEEQAHEKCLASSAVNCQPYYCSFPCLSSYVGRASDNSVLRNDVFGCDLCAADRGILESECGETGYVIDEETCEGQCDGVKDACDFCPDNPDYGRKEIKKYVVPGLTICGTYLYAGESCGYSIVQCDRSEEYHPISPQVIDAHEMARCCRAKVEEEECVVDENCNPNKDEGVCECPDGSTNCDTCQDGKCTCPDLDGDGAPDSP
jgi:hypothetical protein